MKTLLLRSQKAQSGSFQDQQISSSGHPAPLCFALQWETECVNKGLITAEALASFIKDKCVWDNGQTYQKGRQALQFLQVAVEHQLLDLEKGRSLASKIVGWQWPDAMFSSKKSEKMWKREIVANRLQMMQAVYQQEIYPHIGNPPKSEVLQALAVLERQYQDHREHGKFGKYQVLYPLGWGAFGIVYRGQSVDAPMTSDIAIKYSLPTRPEEFARARAEWEFMSNPQVLTSGHILQAYDYVECKRADGRWVCKMIMKYANSGSLEDIIDQGQIPEDEALAIMLQIARGLMAAHKLGIVHRDLKPANILVDSTRDGQEKSFYITDFGLAKSTNLNEALDLSRGVVMGTPFYLSPERLVTDAIGPQTDIFALGVILYEMLSGQLPFAADNLQSLLARIAQCNPIPIKYHCQISKSVADLVAHMMEKDPRKRIQNAEQLAFLICHKLQGKVLGMTGIFKMPERQGLWQRIMNKLCS